MGLVFSGARSGWSGAWPVLGLLRGPVQPQKGQPPSVPCTFLLGPGWETGAHQPLPLCASPATCCPPLSPTSLGTDRWKAQLSLPALSQIFGDYYHFWHRAVTKRSLSPHRLRHSQLQREPQVSEPRRLLLYPSLPALRSASLLLSLLHPHCLPHAPTGPVATAAGGKTTGQTGCVPGAHGPQVSPAVVPGTLPPWALGTPLQVQPSVH